MDRVDYATTFICVAPDSRAVSGIEPPVKQDAPSVVARSFRMVSEHPYEFTSGDVIFSVWADRQGILAAERERARAEFYARPQACLRSSDLGKRYGWGIHADADGRIALYGVDSPQYAVFEGGTSPLDGSAVAVTRAMRSSR